jgi:dimethylargininase
MADEIHAFDSAIVRRPAPSVAAGLRALDHGDPNFEGVSREHDAYVAALRDAGVDVEVLDPLDDFPDALFVEDPALVFTAGAILLRAASPSRAGEAGHLEPVLTRRFDRVSRMGSGYADGGDILRTPDKVMIGLSARTTPEGAEELVRLLAGLGETAEVVKTPEGVLHFKSDCALLDEETVLSTARLSASGVFAGFRVIVVPEGETAAANALRVNDRVFLGAGFPRIRDLLDRAGYTVVALATSEIAKIDAGLSCMSLRWRR